MLRCNTSVPTLSYVETLPSPQISSTASLTSAQTLQNSSIRGGTHFAHNDDYKGCALWLGPNGAERKAEESNKNLTLSIGMTTRRTTIWVSENNTQENLIKLTTRMVTLASNVSLPNLKVNSALWFPKAYLLTFIRCDNSAKNIYLLVLISFQRKFTSVGNYYIDRANYIEYKKPKWST